MRRKRLCHVKENRMEGIGYFFRKLLFSIRIRFDKRTVRKILRTTSCELTEYKCHYMCVALSDVINRQYGVKYSLDQVRGLFGRYGFTRERYHAFVREEHPRVKPYLSKYWYSSAWVNVLLKDRRLLSRILLSKRMFLRELAKKI